MTRNMENHRLEDNVCIILRRKETHAMDDVDKSRIRMIVHSFPLLRQAKASVNGEIVDTTMGPRMNVRLVLNYPTKDRKPIVLEKQIFFNENDPMAAIKTQLEKWGKNLL